MVKLSVIIVNYNVYRHLVECINSVKNTLKGIDYEILVVDNNSTERDIDNITSLFPDVKLLKMNSNKGFGAANNFGVKHSSGSYLLLINPDIIVKDVCIATLLNFVESRNDVGAASPSLYKPSGEFDYYNSFFPSVYSVLMLQFSFYDSAKGMKERTFGVFDDNLSKGVPFQVEQAMGSCILIRKPVFEELSGFDEAFFLYQEETDLEYRMTKKGLKMMILPEAKAIHLHHASTEKLGKQFVSFHWLRSIIIFYVKNFGFLKRTMLRITMFISLLLREIKYIFIYFFKPKMFMTVSSYAFRLIILNFKPRNFLLRDRFIFENKNG